MSFEEFVYPNIAEPLLSAYGGRYESVFVLLHPFVRVPHELSWQSTRHYPNDAQILAHAAKHAWMQVAEATGLSNCARVSQALLGSIDSLPDHLADAHNAALLREYLQAQPVWMPVEGRFEPLLRADMLATFTAAAHRELVFVSEFPQSEPAQTLTISDLQSNAAPFPERGSLVVPDASFLFTVDWDSFFTLYYGPRALISAVAAARNVEGFFAAPTTEHAWFNYNMGCATVTLSPEHWQSVPA